MLLPGIVWLIIGKLKPFVIGGPIQKYWDKDDESDPSY